MRCLLGERALHTGGDAGNFDALLFSDAGGIRSFSTSAMALLSRSLLCSEAVDSVALKLNNLCIAPPHSCVQLEYLVCVNRPGSAKRDASDQCHAAFFLHNFVSEQSSFATIIRGISRR